MKLWLSIPFTLWVSLMACDRKPSHTQNYFPDGAIAERDTVIEEQLDLGLPRILRVKYSLTRSPQDTQYSSSVQVFDGLDTLYTISDVFPWDPQLAGAFRIDRDTLRVTESRRSEIQEVSEHFLTEYIETHRLSNTEDLFKSFWQYYSGKDILMVSFIYAFETSSPLLAYHPKLKRLVPIYAP